MIIRNFTDVSAFINQKFGEEINWGTFKLSGNERCRILTFVGQGGERHPAIMKMRYLQKRLPQGLGVYERKGRFYFAPIMTAQQKLDFAEIEAWVIGTELLKLTELKLALIGEYGTKLEQMVNAKRMVEAETS